MPIKAKLFNLLSRYSSELFQHDVHDVPNPEDHWRDLHKSLSSHYSAHHNQLDDAQKQAITDQSGALHHKVNSYLRSGKKVKPLSALKTRSADYHLHNTMHHLDSSLHSQHAPHDFIAMRGIDNGDAYEPGKTYQAKAYTSTTIHPSISKAFGRDTMHIHVPKGHAGSYIEPHVKTGEHEFLLPRGAKFKIHSKVKQGDHYHIHASLVK